MTSSGVADPPAAGSQMDAPPVCPFDPCESFETRMQGLAGMARWDYVEKTYIVGRKTNLFIWDSSGKVRVKRSKLNQRAQKTIAMRYARIFLKKGLMSAFRGKILHNASSDTFDDDGLSFDELLGGATCIESIIIAESIDSSNQNVIWVKTKGIPGTVEFDERTPGDVKLWSIQESNSYHFGSELTIVEMYDQAEPAQAYSTSNLIP